jgi:hypothetical protein
MKSGFPVGILRFSFHTIKCVQLKMVFISPCSMVKDLRVAGCKDQWESAEVFAIPRGLNAGKLGGWKAA